MGSPSDIQGFKTLLTGYWQRFQTADTHRPAAPAAGVEGKQWVEGADGVIDPTRGSPERSALQDQFLASLPTGLSNAFRGEATRRIPTPALEVLQSFFAQLGSPDGAGPAPQRIDVATVTAKLAATGESELKGQMATALQARYDALLAPVRGITGTPDEEPYRNQVQFVRAAEAGELVEFARSLGIELEVRS